MIRKIPTKNTSIAYFLDEYLSGVTNFHLLSCGIDQSWHERNKCKRDDATRPLPLVPSRGLRSVCRPVQCGLDTYRVRPCGQLRPIDRPQIWRPDTDRHLRAKFLDSSRVLLGGRTCSDAVRLHMHDRYAGDVRARCGHPFSLENRCGFQPPISAILSTASQQTSCRGGLDCSVYAHHHRL